MKMIQFAENGEIVRELNSRNSGSKPPSPWRGFFASPRAVCQRRIAS
jgi:hypothetical protein